MSRYESNSMQDLVGKVITAIDISEDEDCLRFTTNQGILYALVDGECCSYSYYHEIFGTHALLNALVESTEDIEMPETPDENNCIQNYGTKIQTSKGLVSIVFRNSSNGYYGGNLHMNTKPPYHPKVWRPILADDWVTTNE